MNQNTGDEKKTAKTTKTATPAKTDEAEKSAPSAQLNNSGSTSWTKVTEQKGTGKKAGTWVDAEVVDEVKKLTKPAIIDDIKSMYHGRTVWRKTATVTETLGKASLATSTVLAFASASEIVNDSSSRILGFVAGSVGTLGLVLTSFANFARNQAIERTDAANMILGSVHVESVPDINQELVISDGGGDV